MWTVLVPSVLDKRPPQEGVVLSCYESDAFSRAFSLPRKPSLWTFEFLRAERCPGLQKKTDPSLPSHPSPLHCLPLLPGPQVCKSGSVGFAYIDPESLAIFPDKQSCRPVELTSCHHHDPHFLHHSSPLCWAPSQRTNP